MIAWAFCVVSSAPQAESLEHQIAWAEYVAAERGWALARVFSGVSSGNRGARKLLDELLAELRATPKEQRPQRVLLIRIDRLGRGDGLEIIGAIAELRKLGVTLFTRDDGELTIARASDALLPVVKSVLSGIENEVRRDKTRNAHARFRAEGKHFGPAPYGTQKDANMRLVPLEPQASYVRKAFELRATGAGYIRIATIVGRDAPSQGVYNGRPRAGVWHRHTVEAMLRCKSYRGVVVKPDLFDRVQSIRNPDFKQRMTQRFPWPLQGIIKCWCGWTLTGMAGGNGKRRRYYHCNHPRAHHNAGEKRPTIQAEKLEEQFLAILSDLQAPDQQLFEFENRSTGLEGLQATLQGDRTLLTVIERRIEAAFDLQASGGIDADLLAHRLEALRTERAEVVARIAHIEKIITMATAEVTVAQSGQQLLEAAATIWQNAPPDGQKEVARLVSVALGGFTLTRELTLAVGSETMLFHIKPSRITLGNRHHITPVDLERAFRLIPRASAPEGSS